MVSCLVLYYCVLNIGLRDVDVPVADFLSNRTFLRIKVTLTLFLLTGARFHFDVIFGEIVLDEAFRKETMA